MKGKNIIIAIIVIAVIGALGYFQNEQSEKQESEVNRPVRLGVSAPLTGEAAAFGGYINGGVELAVKEINESGGINGQPIEIISIDDHCSASGVDAVSKLVNLDNETFSSSKFSLFL